MAIADTLSGSIYLKLNAALSRAQTYGGVAGKDALEVTHNQAYTDGTGSNQASGWFSSSLTVTTDGITISLADSEDPLGAAGDDVPTSDPEGLKLRAIVIFNDDSTNFVTLQDLTLFGLSKPFCYSIFSKKY